MKAVGGFLMSDLKAFEEDLRLENLAEGTIKGYILALKKLPSESEKIKAYISEHRSNSMLIQAYRKYLHYQRKIGQISSEQLLAQLYTFKPPKHRGQAQNGKWIPRTQWEVLVANGPTRCAKMGIWIALQFGLRVGEITHLRVEDIDLTQNKVLIQQRPGWHPKHYRDRFIPMTKEQHEILERWITERPTLDHPYVIYTTRNNPVTDRTFQRWVAKASNNELKPHDLRRSFAKVLYYESKKNLKLVQLTLGHANIATTSRYLGLEEEEIQQEYIKAMS